MLSETKRKVKKVFGSPRGSIDLNPEYTTNSKTILKGFPQTVTKWRKKERGSRNMTGRFS